MQEPIVIHETAKLAKHVGFDWETFRYYMVCNEKPELCYKIEDSGSDEREYRFDYDDFLENWNFPYVVGEEYSAPPQSLLQKYLMDIHGIYVCPDFSKKGWSYHFTLLKDINLYYKDPQKFFDSFEEALEAGLQEALQLLLKNKKS